MALKSGGELVVEALRRAGVEKIFSLHGAHIDPIFQACLDADLPIVDTRHEMNAGHAAEGYAKVTRKLGVAAVTAGGGTTNVVTSMANALVDRTPVLYLCGSGEFNQVESNALQTGYNPVALATPVTKWAQKALTIEQIPRLVDQAIRIAMTAPRGPVMLDLSWTLLFGSIEEGAAEAASPEEIRSSGVSAADAKHVAGLLAAAKRPVIIVGSEAKRADMRALARLAVATGAAVFSDYEGYSLLNHLPEGYSGGVLQRMYGLGDNAPDVILMLGVRFGLFTAMGTGIFIPHSSRVVQIDPDAREFGRLQPIELGIVADIAPTIDVLAEAAEAASTQSDEKSAFRSLVQQHVGRRYEQISQRIADDSEKLHPMRASEVIARHVNEDIAIVTDGAVCCSWFCEVLPTTRPADLLPGGALSTMGFGFGTAVGAQAALPAGKRVMLVTGDGALGYSLAEFDTIVRHKLPVIVIVLNNESWGATLLFQQLTAGPNRITGTLLENGRYEGVAAALGAASYFADSAESLDAALKKALASDEPACINVIIDVQPIPPELLMVMGQDPFGDPQGH